MIFLLFHISVCMAVNVGIKEWITSVTKNTEYDTLEFTDSSLYSNALQDFEHFLLRSSRKRITSNFARDIVLIKDLPNAFLNDGTLLHDTLNKYLSSIKSTLVFILNDEQLIYKLFPVNIIACYNINQIKFNPINDTGLIKTLQNIIKFENIPISNDTIISIIQNCNGNLTYAINQLYFTTVKKEKVGKQSKLTVKMLKDNKPDSSQEKNRQISYFQSIGRVLYPKREPVASDVFYKLKKPGTSYRPKDLFQFKHNPNDLVQEFITQPNSSIDVLQENYPGKFNSIKQLVASATMFSNIDQVASSYNFFNRSITNEMNLQLVIRSLLNNEHVVTSYAPVRKSAKHLLPDKNELNKSVHSLFSEMLPHESSLNVLFDVLSIVKQCPNYMNIAMNANQAKFIFDCTFK